METGAPPIIGQTAPKVCRAIKERPPLAELAAAAASARTISPADAKAYINQPQFELGGNSFKLFNAGSVDPRLPVQVVSHLGSIFKGLSLGIHFTLSDPFTFVSFRAADKKADYSLSLHGPAQKALYRFEINFHTGPDDIRMVLLRSDILGKGGEALLALYNIARGIPIGRISYAVRGNNEAAKLFYRNMGFGEPINSALTEWVVKVKLSL